MAHLTILLLCLAALVSADHPHHRHHTEAPIEVVEPTEHILETEIPAVATTPLEVATEHYSPPEHPFSHEKTHHYPPPSCSENTTKPFCLEDATYPAHEIERAASKHVHKLLAMYADVADLSDATSVDRSTKPSHVDASNLCPSDVAFIRPLRAINTDGKWRIIVNGVKVGYEKLTQTNRIEECLTAGEPCPLLPHCYPSTCLQKTVYHRYLVYNPYDPYFPFVVESFQLPASCACHIEEYNLSH